MTAAVGIPLVAVLGLLAPDLWAFGCVLSVFSALGALELLRCVEPGLKKRLYVWPMATAFGIPLWEALGLSGNAVWYFAFLLCFLMFLELLNSFRAEKPLDFTMVSTALLGGVLLPMLLSSLVRMGLRPVTGRAEMMLPLAVAFSCDGGAYFVGRKWGRHKMAPRLSPHKTWEGAAGGLLSAVAGAALVGGLSAATGFRVNFPLLLLFALAAGVVCQLGDLFFSAVKRIGGIKDYGNVLPGHGGVLDRCDSIYFSAVLLELLTAWLPVIRP